MWKAAFSGRSETAGGSSANGRTPKDESRRKKSSHSHRAESVISSSSRRDDDYDRERKRNGRSSSLYDNSSSVSRYQDAASSLSLDTSAYGTAPSSRVGEPRPLTESALRMLPEDDDEWLDEDRDTRSEKKSRRREKERESGDDKRKRRSTRGDKDRSRSRSQERKERRPENKISSSSGKSREKDRERKPSGSARSIPAMGSFEQFPGQYSGGAMGPPQSQDTKMSGGLPSATPQQQFPNQDPPRPQMPASSSLSSWGAAAEYYMDQGQSVHFQPGNRASTPNMLVNPDYHLVAASAEAVPAQDTGHGSAADFFSGKVSPVPFSSAPTTPAKATKPGKQSSFSAGKVSKPQRTSSLGAAASALAAAGGVALGNSSYRHSASQQQATSFSSNRQPGSSSSKQSRPARHSSDGNVYYSTPSNNTYPQALPSTNGYGPATQARTGTSDQKSTNSSTPLYTAGAAAATAGFAAYEDNKHNQYNSQTTSTYDMAASRGLSQGAERSIPHGASGYGQYASNDSMQQQHYHEHKGPITRLKDGLFNLISTPEDTAKMEMYTEYIGVCKHCFDPRTSAWDAPRVHHYHRQQDSFEDLRRRRSYDRMGRKISNDSLRRQNSTRVDKDSRYYASESSRRKRDSNGIGVLGAGLAAAGAAAGANAIFNDGKNFDDTYSVKSGHRESSAVRRRSRSSSRERRRRSSHGIIRSDQDEYVTVRTKDGRRVARKSRSNSRDRTLAYTSAAAGAAVGAAGLAASARRRSKNHSRSRSPSVLNGTFGTSTSQSGRNRRSSPRSSYSYVARDDREEESQGIFGGFFSSPKKTKKRRSSREHQKKRRGFFTFKNGSSSSSDSDLAFGNGISSRTNLPLRRKSSTLSSRSGRRASRRTSDEHIAATVAGLGATAAALAAAQRGSRITKRKSRPELGNRRDVKHHEQHSPDDDEWEDELPSDVDDESSVDGGLAFGDYGGRRLSSRQSLESVGSQSSAGGLSAWAWRWGGKDKKRRSRDTSASQQTQAAGSSGPFVGAVDAGLAAGAATYDTTRPSKKPGYLDDSGRPVPSNDSVLTGSATQAPMQYVDPRPISDAGSVPVSRHASIPGAFDDDLPIVRPGPGPIQQPRPIAPSKPSFTQSPPEMHDSFASRPNQPRRSNSSPTRGHFAQDAALIGGAALATAGILAGASATGKRSKESSNVRFGLTEEQQRKEDRERKSEEKRVAEDRRRADRTRALKEEAERAAKEAREEDVRRAREEENRKAAEAKLAAEREVQERTQREADERARWEADQRARREADDRIRREAQENTERERMKEQARQERERLEREARDRQEAAAAAAAEVERHRLARQDAERQAGLREQERRDREETTRQDESRRRREAEQQDRYTREQVESVKQDRQNNDPKQPMPWGSVAAGAAAAATVGAVMAGKEHEKSRQWKSRDDSYYDDAHAERQYRSDTDWRAPEQDGSRRRSEEQVSHDYRKQRNETNWEEGERKAGDRAAREQAEIDRVARERYGRGVGVEVRDGYVAAEIKPKNEHEGEPLMDDDLNDPDYFTRRHTLAERARYAEFARRAADKVVSADKVMSEREDAYKEQDTSYADFFAPKDLLSKAGDDKTRSVSPDPDNVVQAWHGADAEIRSHFTSSDYGYGRSKHAPYGVPKLNVISPTPPPISRSGTPEGRKGNDTASSSPASKYQDSKSETSRSTPSKKSERSRSISWGEDKTHVYDVQTPESYHDRDSYITSPNVREDHDIATVAGVTGAAVAGTAIHQIMVEEPDGHSRTFSEEEWSREEKNRADHGAEEDDQDVEDVTPEPEPQPALHGFYQQPFVDSVSDMGTGIFNLDSPGTEGAPPQRGFVEGETEESTPKDEKAPHIPGGFDDNLDDIYRPRQLKDELTAADDSLMGSTVPDATRTAESGKEPAWEPPLSKKEKKKRDKAAQRAGSVTESSTPNPIAETARVPADEAPSKSEITVDDYFPSKKTKKKRDKSKQTGFADIATTIMSEPTEDREVDQPSSSLAESEPPLSKQEQKKRDKRAKKQGLADIADTVLAAGGIAAAAAAFDSNEDLDSPNIDKKKKGKKSKLGESVESDPRDLVSSASLSDTATAEPTGMPGSWDNVEESQRRELQFDEATIDPFQYQMSTDSTTPAVTEPPAKQDLDPRAEWSEPSPKSKKAKRGSAAFSMPDVSSPLRTEVPLDDHAGQTSSSTNGTAGIPYAHVNGHSKDVEATEISHPDHADNHEPLGDLARRDSEYFEEEHEIVQSPRQVSPDDSRSGDSRSVASAPTPDYNDNRKFRRGGSRRGSDYFDGPPIADETQSIAASEPTEVYGSSRKSKRRSRHADDDDDVASVTSTKSRRDRGKEESPSAKKDKKGGILGLFSRKSADNYRAKDRSDGGTLSRESTRESRHARDDEDDESRRRRRKKHRDSEYDDDDNDDDARSMKSESRRRRSTKDDEYDPSTPTRNEPSDRHHRRRFTDDDRDTLARRDSRESRRIASQSGDERRHRLRTDEEANESSSKDQSFLGMRVEDLPPLPASSPASPDLAAREQQRGEGSPADAKSGTGLVDPPADFDINDPHKATLEREAEDQVPETPVASLEVQGRPSSLYRPPSATTVPLRFPFGPAPQTPGVLKERAHSFSSPIGAGSSPVSPVSGKQTRQGRPHSSEIRPLYLVERNRKTPEVEDVLPSLPSSKPSSRASSVHGSDDNYQSAVEEFEADSPGRARKLTLNIDEALGYRRDDILDSQQTTPKASEFVESAVRLPKQEPQFYTWEDFALDERMHEEAEPQPSGVEAAHDATVQISPAEGRRQSRSPVKNTSAYKSAAAAAMLGTAAVYAHHKVKDRSPDRQYDTGRRTHDDDRGSTEAYGYPLPAPVPGSAEDPAIYAGMEPPYLPRSSEKKTLSRGKDQPRWDEETETPKVQSVGHVMSSSRETDRQETDVILEAQASAAEDNVGPEPISEIIASAPPDVQMPERRDTDVFLETEAQAEEGTASPNMREAPGSSSDDVNVNTRPRLPNALDQFFYEERDMEEGAIPLPSVASHTIRPHALQDTRVTPMTGVFATSEANDNGHFRHQQQAMNLGPEFLPSAAAHTVPFAVPLETRASEPGLGSGVTKRFTAFPTPAGESTDQFERQMEAGASRELGGLGTDISGNSLQEDPSAISYRIPATKVEPAPLDVEQRHVQVEHNEPAETEAAPQLTKKQSKKDKKKQKAAALIQDEPVQIAESSVFEKSESSRVDPSLEKAEPDVEQSERVAHATRSTSSTTPHEPDASSPSVKFGIADFSSIAGDTSSTWHDTQTQAFNNSRLQDSSSRLPLDPEPAETRDILEDQIHTTSEDATESQLESTAERAPLLTTSSSKKSKKDRKKQQPTWSEPDAENIPGESENFRSTVEANDAETTNFKATAAEVAIAAVAGAATMAVATEASSEQSAFEEPKSKKRAKKDKKKKKQSLDWGRLESDPQETIAPIEPQGFEGKPFLTAEELAEVSERSATDRKPKEIHMADHADIATERAATSQLHSSDNGLDDSTLADQPLPESGDQLSGIRNTPKSAAPTGSAQLSHPAESFGFTENARAPDDSVTSVDPGDDATSAVDHEFEQVTKPSVSQTQSKDDEDVVDPPILSRKQSKKGQKKKQQQQSSRAIGEEPGNQVEPQTADPASKSAPSSIEEETPSKITVLQQDSVGEHFPSPEDVPLPFATEDEFADAQDNQDLAGLSDAEAKHGKLGDEETYSPPGGMVGSFPGLTGHVPDIDTDLETFDDAVENFSHDYVHHGTQLNAENEREVAPSRDTALGVIESPADTGATTLRTASDHASFDVAPVSDGPKAATKAPPPEPLSVDKSADQEEQEAEQTFREAEDEPAEQFSWASTSKKKGKKGKKGRKVESEPAIAPNPPVQANEDVEDDPAFLQRSPIWQDEADNAALAITEPTSEQTQFANTEPSLEQKHEWTSSRRKGKKSKKGRQSMTDASPFVEDDVPADRDKPTFTDPTAHDQSPIEHANVDEQEGHPVEDAASGALKHSFNEFAQDMETIVPERGSDDQPAPTIEQQPDEFSWAPTSKKRGKKSKQARQSVSEPPTSQPGAATAMDDAEGVQREVQNSEPTSTVNDVDQEALPNLEENTAEDTQEDFTWTSNKKKKKKDKKAKSRPYSLRDTPSDTDVSSSDVPVVNEPVQTSDFREDVSDASRFGLMSSLDDNTASVQHDHTEPASDIPAGSRVATPIVDASESLDATDQDGKPDLASSSFIEDVEMAEKPADNSVTDSADGLGTSSINGKNQPTPADSTFADGRADENLATQEVSGVFKDLVEEPSTEDPEAWAAPSKKSNKKKKGKRASIADVNPVQEMEGDSVEGLTEERGTEVEERPLWPEPTSGKKKGKKGKKSRQPSTFEEFPSSLESDTHREQPSAVENEAEQRGLGRDDPEIPENLSLETPSLHQDLTVTEEPSDMVQSGEGQLLKAQFAAEAADATYHHDHKGDFAELDEMESAEPAVDIPTAVAQPESQDHTEPEASSPWTIPTTGKKGKKNKNKKGKQVFDWAEEPSTEPAAGDFVKPVLFEEPGNKQSALHSTPLQVADGQDKLEVNPTAMGETGMAQISEDDRRSGEEHGPPQSQTQPFDTTQETPAAELERDPVETSFVPSTKVVLQQDETSDAQMGAATDRMPTEVDGPEEGQDLESQQSFGWNEEEFVLGAKPTKKAKKGKKSRQATSDILFDTSQDDERSTPPSKEQKSEEDNSTLNTAAAVAAASAVTAASATNATEEAEADEEWGGFSSKKSKKAKKRAKKSGFATPATAQDDVDSPRDRDSAMNPQETAGDIPEASSSLTSSKVVPVAEEWLSIPGPEARTEETSHLSGTAGLKDYEQEHGPSQYRQTPGEQLESTPYTMWNVTQPEILEDNTLNDAANTHLPLETPGEIEALQEAVEDLGDHADLTFEHGRDGTEIPQQRLQDIDFTATVAAGLADTGFNPDLVINDPAFQRRASPPGAFPEAEPDEARVLTSKQRKGKKAKRSSGIIDSLTQSRSNSGSRSAGDSFAVNDFDSTITQSLQGAGFDPTLLETALSSTATTSSRNVADEPEEFGFTTSKRKRGKKGRISQPIPSSSPPDSTSTPIDDAPTTQPLASDLTGEVMTRAVDNLQDRSVAEAPSGPTQQDDVARHGETTAQKEQGMAMTTDERTLEHPGTPVNILTVGGDEMDMDEMDRQYRAYKKNKRQQKKKLKGASTAAGLSTPTDVDTADVSAAVSDNDALSRNTTASHALSPRDTTPSQAEHHSENTQQRGGLEAATMSSVVQSVFPGLDRISRRTPTTSEGSDRDQRLSASSRAAGELHDSQLSQTLPDVDSRSPPSAGKALKESSSFVDIVGAAVDHQKAAQDNHSNEPTWSFAGLQDESTRSQDSPAIGRDEHQPVRDSGYQEIERAFPSVEHSRREIPEILHTSSSRDSLRERRSLEPLRIPTSSEEGIMNGSLQTRDRTADTHSRTPSAETPLKPTSKGRTSYLFQTPPDILAAPTESAPLGIDRQLTPPRQKYDAGVHVESGRDGAIQSPTNEMLSPRLPLDAIPEEHKAGKRSKAPADIGGPEQIKVAKRAETSQTTWAGEQAGSPSPRPGVSKPNVDVRSTDESIDRLSWPAVDNHHDAVHTERLWGQHQQSRSAGPDARSSSVMSNRSNTSGTHFRSPQELRSYSRASNHSHSSTPSLRRTSLSGDLRAASRRGGSGSAVGVAASPKTIPFEPPPTPPLNEDELDGSSLSRGVDMNDDVFVGPAVATRAAHRADQTQQGYGDAQGSQVSPTRPPSVRKRQSMHISDLETRLDQLTAENRALQEARQYNGQSGGARSVDDPSLQDVLTARDIQLQEKDAEISKIKAMLEPLQVELARLTEINSGLTESNRNLVDDANGRYASLQAEHSQTHEQWQASTRELETMRQEHGRLTSGMQDMVEAEVASALADKNAEILRLREQLDIAAEQIRALQVQITSSKSSDFLEQRDEDYFDGACQKLCQHVQQWVLRFSKLSDNRVCRLSTELNDDKIEARLDNAILDGSDVDKLLGDRIRRRDVFMSLVMTMVWEYIFTRYLFGMDREQRQKLKALEKTLAEVGPARAVAHWRATTLTLLSKRAAFATQCTMDTEAVVHEIFRMLSTLLPPPSNAEQQLLASLMKVINIAISLSIEMRTQRAEYIMLPPLQPEYDNNGDLVRKVHFNASLMNERSGFFSSNEELAAEHAVVKIVLFPLVVKKGDDVGEGEEEIVVCPAQVLVQNDGNRGKKVVRVMSGAMEIDEPIRNRQSKYSLVSEAPGSAGF